LTTKTGTGLTFNNFDGLGSERISLPPSKRPMYFIFWYDYVALPIYLLLLWGAMNYYFKRKHKHEPELKQYFKYGAILKVVGCLAIGIIYEKYYKGVYDGRYYFEGAKMLHSYWLDHPGEFFRSLFGSIEEFNSTNVAGLSTTDVLLYANEAFFVAKVAGLFNFLAFDMFLPCSLFFCYFSFIGIWKLFVLFVREFNLDPKIAAFATIYIPSVLVWDSSIFKDTISFTALCWLFVCGYYSFIKPQKLLRNLTGVAVASFLIASVKIYIIAAFAPFFVLYIFNSYKSKIKNQTLRRLSTPFILVTAGALIFVFLNNTQELLGRYAFDQVLESASTTYNSITTYGGVAGSSYKVDFDVSTPLGLLTAIPQGINLTLFRPYPWEYLKPFILMASAESMVLLYFTIMLFFKGGIKSTFRLVYKSPLMQFCLLFSFTFAFMTGISSANFGTLVRYKIPCMPFYILFLVILYKEKVLEREMKKEAAAIADAQWRERQLAMGRK
jgi:hypothetical protein